VKLPFVPGPSDVISALGGVREGVTEALALVPRLVTLVGRVESLLDRVTTVVDRVEGVVDRADAAITAVGATNQKADDAITAVGGTIARSDGAVSGAEGLIGRMDPMVDVFQEPLLALAPAVRRLAASIDPDEVEAVVAFIDRLPQLMTHLDEDILPVIGSLGSVGTDVHDLLDTMQDLRHVVKGFPGSRLFRRRGAEEFAEDVEQEAAEGR
jgi:hypothetical protein